MTDVQFQPEPERALTEAILAVDACVSTLVLARVALERALQANGATPQEPEPFDASPQVPSDECDHRNEMALPNGVILCPDCGRNA